MHLFCVLFRVHLCSCKRKTYGFKSRVDECFENVGGIKRHLLEGMSGKSL